jgi:uncharacterized membrane protein (UPF0182 family)
VQPVYLQATGTNGAPTELTFVIVATGEQVEMRPTLEEALAAVAGNDEADGPGAGTAGAETSLAPGAAPITGTVADALDAYERGQKALQEGDWAAYGEAQEELGGILDTLARSAGVPTELEPVGVATPVP